MSRTQEALVRIARGETVRAVARDLNISAQTIYAASKREREAVRCPCCGRTMKINKAP